MFMANSSRVAEGRSACPRRRVPRIPFFFQCPVASSQVHLHSFLSFGCSLLCPASSSFCSYPPPFAPSKFGQSAFKVLAQKLFPHESLLPGQQKAPTLRGPMAKRGNERRPIYWRRRRKQCPRLALITFFPPFGRRVGIDGQARSDCLAGHPKAFKFVRLRKSRSRPCGFWEGRHANFQFSFLTHFFGNSLLFQHYSPIGLYCFVRGNGRLWQWQKIK